MVYVYFDESGNLGFSKRSTKNFVVGMVVPLKRREVLNCVKHTRKRKLQKKYRKIAELKFSKATEGQRKYLLKCLGEKNVDIYYLNVEKSRVYPELRKVKNRLYTYISGVLFTWLVENYPSQHFNLVVDKSLPKYQRENFDWYVKNRSRLLGNKNILISIIHENSQNNLGLQVVDFVTGALYHKYEKENDGYYDLIKDKIKIGGTLWKDINFY